MPEPHESTTTALATIPRFVDIPDDERMALRCVLEAAGCSIVGYNGPGIQVALPCPAGDAFLVLRDAGLILNGESLHYFPLGSDKPEARLRHDGGYPGSKGFWLYAQFDPSARALEIARMLLQRAGGRWQNMMVTP
jgi:hypothetical protein